MLLIWEILKVIGILAGVVFLAIIPFFIACAVALCNMERFGAMLFGDINADAHGEDIEL